jgi:hypothetical protein
MSTHPHITPTGTPGFISTPLAIHAPTTTTTNFTSEEVNVTYPLKKIKVINISKKKQKTHTQIQDGDRQPKLNSHYWTS